MKTFLKAVMIIIEVMMSIVAIPFLGACVASAIAFPIIGLPLIAMCALYIVICIAINKAIFGDTKSSKE